MMDDSCGSVAEMNKYQKPAAVWMRSKYAQVGSFSGYQGSVSRCCVWTMAGCILPPPLFTLHHPAPPPESTLPVDCVATKS